MLTRNAQFRYARKSPEGIVFPVLSMGYSLRHELLSCYTMSGSFLSSLEKRLEEYANIAYETQIKRATPAAIYGMLLSVEITVCGFIIAPRTIAKTIIPTVR